LWLRFVKSSFIKSTFCEVDFLKNWCLVKTVVEVVVFKKAVLGVWLQNCGSTIVVEKKQFCVW
jgi:hypothetical protein